MAICMRCQNSSTKILCMHELRGIENLKYFSQMPFLFRVNFWELALILSKNSSSKIKSIKDYCLRLIYPNRTEIKTLS